MANPYLSKMVMVGFSTSTAIAAMAPRSPAAAWCGADRTAAPSKWPKAAPPGHVRRSKNVPLRGRGHLGMSGHGGQ